MAFVIEAWTLITQGTGSSNCLNFLAT